MIGFKIKSNVFAIYVGVNIKQNPSSKPFFFPLFYIKNRNQQNLALAWSSTVAPLGSGTL